MEDGKKYEGGYCSNIHKSVLFGERVKVGSFCVIEERVIIGSNVTISDYVKIPAGSYIGNDCVIGSYVRLGKSCKIEGNVNIKCKAVISPDVKIGANSFIGPAAMLLHATPDGTHKPCSVGRHCFIGANVTILPGAKVYDQIIVAAKSVVTKTLIVTDGVYSGIPARLTRRRMSRDG